MVADTHIGAGSVLAGAVGLAQASVCCTLVHVWKEKGKWREKKTVCSGYLSKIQTPSDARHKRRRLYHREFIFSTFLKPGKLCHSRFASHLSEVLRADPSLSETFLDTERLSVKMTTEAKKKLILAHELVYSCSQTIDEDNILYHPALTLASPSPNQHVALLAFAVVRAHAVDTAAPLAV